MNSRIPMKAKPVFVFLLFSISILACSGKLQPYKSQNKKALDYTIQLDVISSGFDGESCWFHPRAGVIPGKGGSMVFTMQKWMVKRSDVFFPLWGTHSSDTGKTWSKNNAGYVAVSKDGLHYGKPIEWKFDNGESLGNYNTQQHWVSHSDGLYLVYTRKGANNDNVIRHRAPLFMAMFQPPENSSYL